MKTILTLSAALLLASCNPTVPPTQTPDLTALVQKCSASTCSSEEEAQIQAGLSIDLPPSISSDETPELKLKGYSGPVTWSLLEGTGSLFGPGLTWTIEDCTPIMISPGEACSYTGTDRWLYFPPWRGASGMITLQARVGRFTLSKTVAVVSGILEQDERRALQHFNYARAIPRFCLRFGGPDQASAPPLRWDARLKQTALKMLESPTQVLEKDYAVFARANGYNASNIESTGTIGVTTGTATIDPDRLFQDAFFLFVAASDFCSRFHDAKFVHMGATALVTRPFRAESTFVLASPQ